MNENLRLKIENIPKKPGVYIMYNSAGDVIYVGKAKVLFSRVRSYFNSPSGHTDKVSHMVKNVEGIDYIICDTESEALLLECNLIKEHKPYYNVMLKDGKSFPFIALSTSEEYPRLYTTRKRTGPKGKFFGPYYNATSAKIVVEAANRIYPLQKCSKKTAYGTKVGKPCLYYHIGQCLGCCSGNVEHAEYKKIVAKAEKAFSARNFIIEDLKAAMAAEAETLNFEAAAVYKDAFEHAQALLGEGQKVAKPSGEDMDIVAIAHEGREAVVQVFRFRDGKMVAPELERMSMKGGAEGADEISASFLLQFYEAPLTIPPTILLESVPSDKTAIQAALSERRGGSVLLKSPQKGEKRRLLELASSNAQMNIEMTRTKAENQLKKSQGALRELASASGAASELVRIEAYDISNISSAYNVGAMVVFENGKKAPKAYRHFRIKSVEGQNDYASISEVVLRRLNRAKNELDTKAENPKFLPLPQLMLIDGGRNQMLAAKRIVSLFGYDIAVCGLAKDSRHSLKALVCDEEVEIPLDKLKMSGSLLYEISEEVHRSAISYHKGLRSADMTASELTEIEGIGAKRAIELLKSFGSIEAISEAGLQALLDVKAMNKKSAEAVYAHFHS
ncbi:MAG: excinuclease ABC subunit UvrC [Eubacteriaceae bacterium]|nr:excinuclease ABC subunit UvrC [Eubacteriaceae bacterium]